MNGIALFSYDYPPDDGGISRLCAAVVSELARRGRGVSVVTLRAASSSGIARPGVATTALPRRRWLREAAAWLQLVRLRRGTCVLASLWYPEGTLALLAGHGDAIVMAHGNEVMAYGRGWRGAVKARLRRHVLASARAVVCNSRYTEGLVRAISADALTAVITPGVDTTRFAPLADRDSARRRLALPLDRRIVLSVSRIDPYKGHALVLEALAQLTPAARQKLRYVVAGRGRHLAALQSLATTLALDDCVGWLGFVVDDDLPALYGAADLFVLCTREDAEARGVEGFGMAFLEAQSAGVPVVGTRAGGISDAVDHGDGGWLIEPGDTAALAGHLGRLAEGDPSFAEQGRRARRRALAQGSWPRYAAALLRLMDGPGG